MSLDDQTIEEGQWVDLYVAGKLSPEDTARFEEYFLTRDDLIDQIEAAERLQRGLRQVAEEEVTRATLQASVEAAQQRSWRRRAGILAFVAVVATGLLFLWNQRQVQQLSEELRIAQVELEEVRNATPPQITELQAQLDQARRELETEREAWSLELDSAKGRAEQIAAQLAIAQAPRIISQIISLSPLRAGNGEEPATVVQRPEEGQSLVLALDTRGAPGSRYRGTVQRGDTVVWQASDLEADAYGSVTLSFSSDSLQAGIYSISLKPLDSAGGDEAVVYRLRLEDR
ncbi:MAG: hypothetical protein AAGD01_17350 [Acidobacteriota bacterium]